MVSVQYNCYAFFLTVQGFCVSVTRRQCLSVRMSLVLERWQSTLFRFCFFGKREIISLEKRSSEMNVRVDTQTANKQTKGPRQV